MFPSRYFAPRFYAGRYFPHEDLGGVTPPDPGLTVNFDRFLRRQRTRLNTLVTRLTAREHEPHDD